MCGRYSNSQHVDDLVTQFVAEGGRADDWRPSYSVAPSQSAPVVRSWSDDGTVTREVELATWGFRPAWAKEGAKAPINARLETVATNGLWRTAFASHRCLVPMSPGYFEWEQREDGKQPYLIHNDGAPLAAAGLYAARKVDDAWRISYSIITTEARDAGGTVHDRMPVFVASPLWDEWLDPGKVEDKGGMLELLEHSSAAIAATMATHPVSRELNNSRTVDRNDPSILEPIDDTSSGE